MNTQLAKAEEHGKVDSAADVLERIDVKAGKSQPASSAPSREGFFDWPAKD